MNWHLEAQYELLHTRHPKADVVCESTCREQVHVQCHGPIAVVSFHCCTGVISHRSPSRTRYVPRESTNSFSCTGFDSVSQLSASNNGLSLRSRSSTSRFCEGYIHHVSVHKSSDRNSEAHRRSLPEMLQLPRDYNICWPHFVWDMASITRRYWTTVSAHQAHKTTLNLRYFGGGGPERAGAAEPFPVGAPRGGP